MAGTESGPEIKQSRPKHGVWCSNSVQGTEQITSASGTAVPGMSSACTGLEGAPGQDRSLPMLPVSMKGEEAEAVPWWERGGQAGGGETHL